MSPDLQPLEGGGVGIDVMMPVVDEWTPEQIQRIKARISSMTAEELEAARDTCAKNVTVFGVAGAMAGLREGPAAAAIAALLQMVPVAVTDPDCRRVFNDLFKTLPNDPILPPTPMPGPTPLPPPQIPPGEADPTPAPGLEGVDSDPDATPPSGDPVHHDLGQHPEL